MLGIDSIIVLPILLLFAVFAAYIAVGIVFYLEAISRSCPKCGTVFMGETDLKLHMKDHKEFNVVRGYAKAA
jgi:hypothetical protein